MFLVPTDFKVMFYSVNKWNKLMHILTGNGVAFSGLVSQMPPEDRLQQILLTDRMVHDGNECARATQAVINEHLTMKGLPPIDFVAREAWQFSDPPMQNDFIENLLVRGLDFLNRVWDAHARIEPTKWNPDIGQFGEPTDMQQHAHVIEELMPEFKAHITMYKHRVPSEHTLQTCVVSRITVRIIAWRPFKTVDYDAGKTLLINYYYPVTHSMHTVQRHWAPNA